MPDDLASKSRKALFGDCALIELIHLHDCLRGAIRSLEADVDELASSTNAAQLTSLERRVTGRFQVIWSVFRAHSSAEDEFIWPALRDKTQGKIDQGCGSCSSSSNNNNSSNQQSNCGGQEVAIQEQTSHSSDGTMTTTTNLQSEQQSVSAQFCPTITNQVSSTITNSNSNNNNNIAASSVLLQDATQSNTTTAANNENATLDTHIEQLEYEEDHASEERMFSEMNTLLTRLREVLVKSNNASTRTSSSLSTVAKKPSTLSTSHDATRLDVDSMAVELRERTERLSAHLLTHLEKEETQCMPLVAKHLSKDEIRDLVGQIMGKRSADTIAQIMSMALQSLDEQDREEMVRHMKQSMAGTFFDKWLRMSGWMPMCSDETPVVASASNNENMSNSNDNSSHNNNINAAAATMSSFERSSSATSNLSDKGENSKRAATTSNDEVVESNTKRARLESDLMLGDPKLNIPNVTSQAELEKLIRAIASNNSLSAAQKNTTIQGLRDSVWRSNQRHKQEHEMMEATVVNTVPPATLFCQPVTASSKSTAQSGVKTGGGVATIRSSTPRGNPPSAYFRKIDEKLALVWTSDTPSATVPKDGSVPLFTAAELAPTYHDGASGAVLGCPHYARACKLRHPKSGRLYTCRLCCEQQREMPLKDPDEPLDRYAVTEVMCMKCNTLQPAEDRCVNTDCESRGKPFAKYFCRICHLYDDGSRPIFHCPYCNTCRLGRGLGEDFRHCAKCNACVSLADDDHHCIPQKLQGSCPICHESLFQSTQPLRGVKCGHVMHLECFTEYRRCHRYTCPLCMRSMEDMHEYFALLDSAVRMQPMPAAYLSTMSNIYCQDCCKTSQVQYHFVGQKCSCGSYNTRELGRFHRSPSSSVLQSI